MPYFVYGDYAIMSSRASIFSGGAAQLVIIQLLEKVSFFFIYSLLAVFFIDFFGESQQIASASFGSFLAITWGLNPVSGIVIDRTKSPIKTLCWGLLLIAIGFGFLAFSQLIRVHIAGQAALALVLLGYALYQVSPLKLLSLLLTEKKEKDTPYTMYYAALNVSMIISLIVVSVLPSRQPSSANSALYFVSFLCASLCAFAALIIAFVTRKRLASLCGLTDQNIFTLRWPAWAALIAGFMLLVFFVSHLSLFNIVFYVIVALGAGYYFFRAAQLRQWRGPLFLVALLFEGFVGYVCFSQMGTSMNFLAISFASTASVGRFAMSPISYQIFNPIWIVLFTPVFAFLYARHVKKHGHNASPFLKFALGLGFAALTFLALIMAPIFLRNGKLPMGFFVFWNIFMSLSQLCISAIGFSMVARYAPKPMSGIAFGLWYAALSLANITGGRIASRLSSTSPLRSYVGYFSIFALAMAAITVLAFCLYYFYFRRAETKLS